MDLKLNPIQLSPQLGIWDLAIVDGDLAVDRTLETPVVLSLFSNARAETHEVPPETESLQGWWGDAGLGSKLWTLARKKKTNDTLNLASDTAKAALAWLIPYQKATAVGVTANYENNTLILTASITVVDKTTTYKHQVI
jgi:phage gp46-like protein